MNQAKKYKMLYFLFLSLSAVSFLAALFSLYMLSVLASIMFTLSCAYQEGLEWCISALNESVVKATSAMLLWLFVFVVGALFTALFSVDMFRAWKRRHVLRVKGVPGPYMRPSPLHLGEDSLLGEDADRNADNKSGE